MLALNLFFNFIMLVQAESFFRLDKQSYEEWVESPQAVVTFMSEGCSFCRAQINDFKTCLKIPSVTLFLEGSHEERLRLELKKSPYPYPVYWTTDQIKKKYEIGKMTPTTVLINGPKRKKIVGRLDCSELATLSADFFKP